MSKRLLRNALVLCSIVLSSFLVQKGYCQSVTFTILSFNDVYQITPFDDGRGGFASMQTLLMQEREKSKHSVTTVNGDFLSPCILSIFDKGAHRIELFNQMDVDMVVLGNHEFDFGPQVVKERIAQSHFPWLTANAIGLDGRHFTGDTQKIIVNVDGIKVGFFGLVTVETPQLSSTENQVCFTPIAFTAKKMVEELKSEGADVIVALTHLLFEEDRMLAKEVPEIDVILGGHDHDPITWYDDKTFIHKSGQNAIYLARIDLSIEKTNSAVKVFPQWSLLLNKGVAEDASVAKMVEGYMDMTRAITSETLCYAQRVMDSNYSTVRTGESVIGNLVADAIKDAVEADLAIISGGIIRGNKFYPKDAPITMKDLYEEMPFGNVNVCVELSGQDILDALENGLVFFDGKAGRFPQVSGIGYVFDPLRPVGSRILSVCVGKEPLILSKTYKVATVDYMFFGGDGYSQFKNGKILISPLRQMSTIASVAQYLKNCNGDISGIEGRIRISTDPKSLDDLLDLPSRF